MIYAAEGAIVHYQDIPMAPILYGVIALGVLIALAFITFSYRDVAHRHSHKTSSQQAGH
jgi:hypothetical protein